MFDSNSLYGKYAVGADTACAEAPVEAYNTTGFPSPTRDYDLQGIDLNAVLMPNRPCTFLAHARGNTLATWGILDGDLIVIDRSLTPHSGQLIAVYIDGAFTLRPYPLQACEADVRIWGVVTAAIHHL